MGGERMARSVPAVMQRSVPAVMHRPAAGGGQGQGGGGPFIGEGAQDSEHIIQAAQGDWAKRFKGNHALPSRLKERRLHRGRRGQRSLARPPLAPQGQLIP